MVMVMYGAASAGRKGELGLGAQVRVGLRWRCAPVCRALHIPVTVLVYIQGTVLMYSGTVIQGLGHMVHM